MGGFAERLKQAGERYKSVGDGPSGPPPGLYKMQLQSAEIMEKKEGGLQIRWQHFVLDGACAGQVAADFSQLTSESDYPIQLLRKRIARLGFNVPDDLSEYEELVPAIMAAGPTYSGRVIHRNGFANVEIEQLLEAKGPARAAPAAVAPAAASVPAVAQVAPAQEPEDQGETVDVGSAVSFVDRGTTYEGTINSFDGNDALIAVPGETDLLAVPLEDLTVLASAPDTDTPEAEAPADFFDDLVAIAEGNSVPVPEGADEAQMVEVLSGYEWTRANLAEHEAAALDAVGIPMVEPAPPPPPRAAPRPAPAAKPKARRTAPKASAKKKAAPKKAKKGARRKAKR